MEKRVFLAIFLSFVILVLYQVYLAPPPTPPAVTTDVAKPAAATVSTPAPAPPASSSGAPATAPVVPDVPSRDIAVETDTISAIFTTKGAVLKSWRLKRYFNAMHEPLELVPQDVPEALARPFMIAVDDAATSAILRNAVYTPSADHLTIGSGTGAIEFIYQDPSGISARKTFQFQPDGKAYVVAVDANVIVGGKPQPVTVAWGPGVGPGYSDDGARPFPTRAIQLGTKVERLAASNLEKQARYEGTYRFAGVEDQYFLSAALPILPPRPQQSVRVDYQPISMPVSNDSQNRTRALVAYSIRTPGASSLAFFVGPKDLNALRAVDPELTGAIDFGMFRVLVVPLLQALNAINSYLGNYGWSIIALTVFINVLIFPLRHRSMVSMKKMQSIQPEIKAIQERYAKYKITDPERQKMNQETMALYKQKGVNPVGGCIPMLLTMPVLFAFYAMLNASIELRGAPFFGWLHDLSTKDPFYITPVVMGGTMFWQQRMMPTTADPVQQKMFLLMPIIFTTMFLSMPSGLVVYWLVSNMLAIGQQYLTNRMIAAPAPAGRLGPPRPGNKALGNSGRGKA